MKAAPLARPLTDSHPGDPRVLLAQDLQPGPHQPIARLARKRHHPRGPLSGPSCQTQRPSNLVFVLLTPSASSRAAGFGGDRESGCPLLQLVDAPRSVAQLGLEEPDRVVEFGTTLSWFDSEQLGGLVRRDARLDDPGCAHVWPQRGRFDRQPQARCERAEVAFHVCQHAGSQLRHLDRLDRELVEARSWQLRRDRLIRPAAEAALRSGPCSGARPRRSRHLTPPQPRAVVRVLGGRCRPSSC